MGRAAVGWPYLVAMDTLQAEYHVNFYVSDSDSKRAIYGFYCAGGTAGNPGMSDYKEGLLYVK